MKGRCRVLSLAAAVLLLGASPPAQAEHGQADPNLNMTHLANEPTTGATNSDLAFWQELAFAGNYNGFRIFSIANPRDPKLLSNFICRGSQSDMGVYGHGKRLLLFQSVDARQTEPTGRCSAPTNGPTGWEGVRIFDVSDPRNPVYVKGVATDCGSHTHTVVPDDKNKRVFIYVSSYPLQGQGTHDDPDEPDHLTECLPPHQKISVIEVPLEAPETAQVVNEPSTGPGTAGCHDIGVFLEIKKAAAACLTEGQIWDISDPVNPVITNRIQNPLVNIWHSGGFTWDGKVAIFGDEEGGAVVTHGCGNFNAPLPGATWFYKVEAPQFPIGYFSQPRPQAPQGELICSTHNYDTIPVHDRYLLNSAFYSAGTGIVDFTAARDLEPSPLGFVRPIGQEIAYYDAEGSDGRGDAETWSSYWYKQYVYGNDINRGFDVFQHLGKETSGARSFHHLNPQTQERLLTGPR